MGESKGEVEGEDGNEGKGCDGRVEKNGAVK